jgi:hypothetical protein
VPLIGGVLLGRRGRRRGRFMNHPYGIARTYVAFGADRVGTTMRS